MAHAISDPISADFLKPNPIRRRCQPLPPVSESCLSSRDERAQNSIAAQSNLIRSQNRAPKQQNRLRRAKSGSDVRTHAQVGEGALMAILRGVFSDFAKIVGVFEGRRYRQREQQSEQQSKGEHKKAAPWDGFGADVSDCRADQLAPGPAFARRKSRSLAVASASREIWETR